MGADSDKIKGRVKQAAGDLTDNSDLKAEGEADEASGKLKDVVDNVKQKANDVIDNITGSD